jgi:hypothetical protein
MENIHSAGLLSHLAIKRARAINSFFAHYFILDAVCVSAVKVKIGEAFETRILRVTNWNILLLQSS